MKNIIGVLAIMSLTSTVSGRQPRILEIAQIGHPCLYKECEPIIDFEDPELHKFMDDFRATFEYDISQTAGLAAPQVHVNKRIILYWDGYNIENYKNTENSMENVREMFNPTYEPIGDELEYRLEGCKSINGLAVDVPRYRKILVKWQDIEGKENQRAFEGREARCLQHEIDHVNGILCLMRADNLTRVGDVFGDRCFLEEPGIERTCSHTEINSVIGRKIGDHTENLLGFGGRVLEIAKIGHPCLYVESEDVEDPTSLEIKEILADMKATIENKGYPFSGLAAPQVHINKKIAFFFGGFHEQRPVPMKFEPLTAMINLYVEPVGDEMETLFERCFSAINFAADVPRYKNVKYRYQNESGEWVAGEATGFTARVLQHEYDHLMGMTCFMRVEGYDRIAHCDANCHTHMKTLDKSHKPW